MESGAIYDSQISASSEHDSFAVAMFGRLNVEGQGGGWAARILETNQWLQIDLINQDTRVVRVATQGRAHWEQWVKLYKLQYSNDADKFHYYRAQGERTDKVK